MFAVILFPAYYWVWCLLRFSGLGLLLGVVFAVILVLVLCISYCVSDRIKICTSNNVNAYIKQNLLPVFYF